MKFTYVYTSGFVKEWNRHRRSDLDLQALEQHLGKAPQAWPVVQATGGLRKARFAPPSWHIGKRGATRVGFAYFCAKEVIVVVAIFTKNETQNFSPAEKNMIRKLLQEAEASFR